MGERPQLLPSEDTPRRNELVTRVQRPLARHREFQVPPLPVEDIG